MIFIEFLKTLPRFFFWTLAFLFGSAIYLGDKFAYWLLFYSRRTEFVRRGGCARTGQCCKNLALQVPTSWARRSWLVKIFNAWYRAIFNFHFLGQIQGNWLVYECHYLKNGNLCSIYPYRPKLCREFPLTPLFDHGNLHKGCGYYFLKRNEIGTFREKLVEKEHEAERQAYLSQRFQKAFELEEGLETKGHKNQGARK